MPDRVVVFIDYQNVYRGARRAFHQPTDPHWMGQFHPLLLGQRLAAHNTYSRTLTQVRVYRGHPHADKDPIGNAAVQRQLHAWSTSPLVKAVTRPLKYPHGWPDRCMAGERPQEKGVDVALAVDFAVMAVREEYDVGILFSTDTDMKPTLEFVAELTNTQGWPRPEVAAWSKPESRLSVRTRNLHCHRLDLAAYEQIADQTSYSKP